MTDNTQPKALQLSDWLDDQYDPDHRKAEAAAELRRLYAENVALQQVLVAAQPTQPQAGAVAEEQPIGSNNGWLEAAIAWEVCASLHRQYCKGKDALFTTRQSDFVKHAEDAREYASYGQAPAQAAPGAVAGQCEDAIELLGKYKDLCEEIKRGDSYHLGRIEAAISVLAQAAPVREEEEREAFKAAHRHLELDEVPDAWGRPRFRHSHVEASWLGWIARAARAQTDSVTAPAGGAVAEPEFDDCPASPTGKHSASWFANGDCEHCKSGAQPDAPLLYTLTPPAQSQLIEDAVRLERERICAAIKAEDDYCVDHGDYMLDSDDCIKIVRGKWVRPDFSVAAARK